MGVASLNLVDELIKAHRLRIFNLPENFICLQWGFCFDFFLAVRGRRGFNIL